MGRICAWCGSILKGTNATGQTVSHAICTGCRSQLEDALHDAGLHLRERSEAGRP